VVIELISLGQMGGSKRKILVGVSGCGQGTKSGE